ncbi:MAG: hypothetical protein ABH803_04485 [Candidatus Micrarchaeota archaeon]
MNLIKVLNDFTKNMDTSGLNSFIKNLSDNERYYAQGILYRLHAISSENVEKKLINYAKSAEKFKKIKNGKLTKLAAARHVEQLGFIDLVKSGTTFKTKKRIKLCKSAYENFISAFKKFSKLKMPKTTKFMAAWAFNVKAREYLACADLTEETNKKKNFFKKAEKLFNKSSYKFDKAGMPLLKESAKGLRSYSQAWHYLCEDKFKEANNCLYEARLHFKKAKEKGSEFEKICTDLIQKINLGF